MYVLQCSDGNMSIKLDKREYYFGTSRENDVVLPEQDLPDIAARLTIEDNRYLLESMHGGNAVKLNGKKIKKTYLQENDSFAIGSRQWVLINAEQPSTVTGDAKAIVQNLMKFTDEVGRERDLRVLLRKIMDSLLELIGGTEAFIFTLDKEHKPKVFVSSSSSDIQKRFSDTIVQETLSSGKGVYIPNALSDPAYAKAESITDLQLISVLCCPMMVAGKIVGVIYLGSRTAVRSFGPGDLDILKVYANLAGMLINHVEYIAQQSTLIRKLSEPVAQDGVVAKSAAMLRVIKDIESIAHSDITVLLQGETGTGKEVLAQLIHMQSARNSKSFVAVNCSSLHGELLESELFGHKRGAFTGAVNDHAGLFAAANGGTLLLDEIGEMDLGLQAKLLRTLESGKIRQVGSTTEEPVDVRIVCATNRNLEQMVDEGKFRKDLFYRLNQFAIKIPPLRERGEDIVHLAYHFLEKYRAQYPHKEVIDFHPDSLKALMFHEWPGNIRELASVIHKAVLTAQDPIITLDFVSLEEKNVNFEQAINDFQRRLLSRAIAACNGNKEKAAAMLELSRSTFFRYVATLGIR